MGVVIHGVVHGNTIELKGSLGVPDGQEVELQVTVIPRGGAPGAGFLRTEGALADDEEWDAIMAEIHQARGRERRSPVADLGDA
jgi:hypothetical protein